MYVRIAMVIITMAVFFCAGCHQGPKRGGPSPVDTWAYTPQSLHVHPLSRFKVKLGEENPEEIIVHIAFKDGDAFQCRAIGMLVLTLSGVNIKNTVKSIDLANPKTNQERFDGLTRTYLIHFNEVPTDLSRVRVFAAFTPSSGNKLRDTGVIEK